MREAIFAQYHDTADQFVVLLSSFSQRKINIVPYDGCWTAAQVGAHVIKSNKSIIQAMNMEAHPAQRMPDERIQELKDVFLDFNTKLQSPDFILPEPGLYKKEDLVDDLEASIDELKEVSSKVSLSGTIDHVAFGDITKLELLHFVVYHTGRHTHQLRKISQLIKNR